MALVRVSTTWFGSAGAPFYSQQYFDGAGDVTHANDCIDAVNLFLNSIQAGIDNALNWVVSGEVEIIDPATGQVLSTVSGTEEGNSGFSSDEALPTFTQLLCRLQTSTFFNGRRLKGRIFIPGMTEGNNTVTGQPSAGYRGTVQSALDVLVADSAQLVIYSRVNTGFARVTGSSTWNQWAVLRSRRD